MMCTDLTGDLCRPTLLQSCGLFYEDSLGALSCMFSALLEDEGFEVS